MSQLLHRRPIRLMRSTGAFILGTLFTVSASAVPPGEPFEELERRVDKLTQRVDVVEEGLVDVNDKLSNVVEVVDLTEALELCVRIFEGELGGLPGPHWIFTGCNVHVRAKNLATDAKPNGLGNLIVGYNEGRCRRLGFNPPTEELSFSKPCLFDDECPERHVCDLEDRGGSHNLVIGHQHRYRSFGAILGGRLNEASAKHSSVLGGTDNSTTAPYSVVNAGARNEAGGLASSVTGGVENIATGRLSAVHGGQDNVASGRFAAVLGGNGNEAADDEATVAGGVGNLSDGLFSSVAGGRDNVVRGSAGTVAGGLQNFVTGHAATVSGGRANEAKDTGSTVSGGDNNVADGQSATVGGGANRSVTDWKDWRAGDLLQDD